MFRIYKDKKRIFLKPKNNNKFNIMNHNKTVFLQFKIKQFRNSNS